MFCGGGNGEVHDDFTTPLIGFGHVGRAILGVRVTQLEVSNLSTYVTRLQLELQKRCMGRTIDDVAMRLWTD